MSYSIIANKKLTNGDGIMGEEMLVEIENLGFNELEYDDKCILDYNDVAIYNFKKNDDYSYSSNIVDKNFTGFSDENFSQIIDELYNESDIIDKYKLRQ